MARRTAGFIVELRCVASLKNAPAVTPLRPSDAEIVLAIHRVAHGLLKSLDLVWQRDGRSANVYHEFDPVATLLLVVEATSES